MGTVVLFDENPSIKSCYFDIINVFKPYGEEVAYTIGGEPDFEEEHGIAVMIRGDQVLAISYRSDWEYTSLWSDEFSARA